MKIDVAGTTSSSSIGKPTDSSVIFREKCKEFESLLINEMISAMEPKNGFFGQGLGGAYFGTLFRQEMAKELSKQLDTGLATQLAKSQIKSAM